MAERVINVTVSNVNTKNVTVSSKQVANEISATADLSVYYSQLAKNWAIGEGLIQNEDYSSKTYAGVAQEAAESAQGSADTAQAFVNDFSGVVDNAITEIDGVKTEALTAVTSSKDLALRDISATQSSALTEIGDLKNSSLTEISASLENATGNITDAQSNAVEIVSTLGDNYISNINTTGDKYIADIGNAGENYIDNINATGKGFDNLTQRQITNCLLEVPQRIKYDLTDGVLTIKKGSQVIVPYGNHERDIIVAGSPTITSDGVASNFSSSNYIELKQTFTTLKSGSEIVFNATLTGGADQRIICFNSYTLHFGVNASNLVKIWISSTGSSWDVANGTTGKTTLSNNVNYYFKFSFTGTAYKVDISTDGVTYNNEITINSSSQVYTLGKAMISNYPSGSGASANGYWRGSIDLSKSYIKNGSDIIWSGADKVLEKYPVGATFLNDNFKVADTQYADGKFFVWVEVVNDFTGGTTVNDNVVRVLSIRLNNSIIQAQIRSGSGAEDYKETYNCLWYNTTQNLMKVFSNGSAGDFITCLPIGLCESDGVHYVGSIKQVFNGMGYIGSTVWVDKGVKGLIPDGRNEDGTLKNIEFTTSTVGIRSTGLINYDCSYALGEDGVAVDYKKLVVSEEQPTTTFTAWYKPSENILYTTGNNAPNQLKRCVILDCYRTSTQISNYTPKLPFHVADIQDVVRKSGDTMSGNLIISGSQKGTIVQCTDLDYTQKSSASNISYFRCTDKNSKLLGDVRFERNTSGGQLTRLSVRNCMTGSEVSAVMGIGIDESGNISTFAPHCSNNTGIVTQAGISKSGNGYMKFGNGIIMQWGQASVSSNKATVTFPTAFSGSFKVTVTPYSTSTGAQNNVVITALSKTTLTVYSEQTFQWLAIGY